VGRPHAASPRRRARRHGDRSRRPIGFVALTAPQPARRLTRTPQLPLLNTALIGARTLLPPLEIPVGALTALVGGPYPLWLPGRPAGTR